MERQRQPLQRSREGMRQQRLRRGRQRPKQVQQRQAGAPAASCPGTSLLRCPPCSTDGGHAYVVMGGCQWWLVLAAVECASCGAARCGRRDTRSRAPAVCAVMRSTDISVEIQQPSRPPQTGPAFKADLRFSSRRRLVAGTAQAFPRTSLATFAHRRVPARQAASSCSPG